MGKMSNNAFFLLKFNQFTNKYTLKKHMIMCDFSLLFPPKYLICFKYKIKHVKKRSFSEIKVS